MKAGRVLLLAPLQIAQAVIGFGAIAAFTRLMSAEEFGAYALALSASMFAHTLVFTWAEAAAYRFLAAARAENRLADHFATLFVLALALAGIAFTLTAGLLLMFGADVDTAALALFVAGSAAFRFLTKLGRETERAESDIARYALSESAYIVLGFGAGVALLVAFDFGPAAPFLGLLLAGATIFAFDAPRFLARSHGGAPSLRRAHLYARYGAPLAFAIALDLGVQTLARFILAEQASHAAIGAYAAAFGLARPIDLIFMWAGVALTPLVLQAYEAKGSDAARKTAGETFAMLAAVTVPATVGLALTAQPLAAFMVGDTLSGDAARALPWLAIAALLGGFNLYYWSEAFQLTRRTGVRAALMFAPGVLQLVLTLMLAPTHGATGAAIAAAAAAATGSVLLALVGRILLPLPLPLPALARICVATAAMALAVSVTPDFTAQVLVGLGVYGLAGLALDICGVRGKASAVWQRSSARLRSHSSPITDSNV